MKAPHRLVLLPGRKQSPADATPEPKRSDPAVPLILAAFCLGVVVAAAAFLGLQTSTGDTVPARQHRDTVAQLAAADAARTVQRERLAAQDANLEGSEALARRLIAAIGNGRVSAAELAALRSSVQSQTKLVERTRVVPGPTVTVAPAPARPAAPPAAARPTPRPSPTAEPVVPSPCAVAVFGWCLTP